MSKPKQKPYSPGTTKSDDLNDPTIYPKKGIEDESCEHGVPNKGDCTMCVQEKEDEDRRKAEEKAEEDKLDQKL